jgi:hypothetical protein
MRNLQTKSPKCYSKIRIKSLLRKNIWEVCQHNKLTNIITQWLNIPKPLSLHMIMRIMLVKTLHQERMKVRTQLLLRTHIERQHLPKTFKDQTNLRPKVPIDLNLTFRGKSQNRKKLLLNHTLQLRTLE